MRLLGPFCSEAYVSEIDFQALHFQVGQVFTPGSPINERDLFAGRIEQLEKIIDTISQKGYHAVLFGERGVGKTSLANIVSKYITDRSQLFVIPRVNCDGSDTFSTLWKRAFKDVSLSKTKTTIGFMGADVDVSESVADNMPDLVSPDDVRRTIEELSRNGTLLIIFDEFDRLIDKNVTVLMSDTIKALSDFGIPGAVLIIGVAGSVGDLIHGHQSIERALVQIQMPRMSNGEIKQILNNGLSRLGMTIDRASIEQCASLSQGLPYITHLLGLHAARAAIGKDSLTISTEHVDLGIKNALEQWQQSIKTSYYNATRSAQPGNLYKEVLLACALAEIDDLGYFTAASVRTPLRVLTGKSYDIPNFAQHLKQFSETVRGQILERVGAARQLRYRFVNPVMKPYIVMRGFAESLLDREIMREIDRA
jgi:energy-coupling factor transporter ATP-binding protein EcfA2